MLIDWFTIIAQIINFLILVFLLRKFLYRPVLKVMQEREEKIKAQLTDAEEKQQAAEEEIALYKTKNQAWDEEHEALLREARHEVDESRKQAMKTLRKEIEAHQTQWEQAIVREKQEFLEALSKKIGAQTFSVVRRVLNDLANVALEAHICNVFINRLETLDEKQHQDFQKALTQSGDPIIFRTAFDLPAETRQRLEETALKIFQVQQPVIFEVDPELVCGIVLRASGYKMVWSLSEYLENLDDLFSEGMPVKMGE